MLGRKKKTKVLIVEDADHMLELLSIRFQNHNYDVLTATRGQEGIDKAIQDNPDAIVLDIMLPEMDGMETCRRLKDNEKTKEIPVVAITALCASIDPEKDSHAKSIYDSGVQAILTKPFSPEELIQRIELVLEYKRYSAKKRPKSQVG